MKHKRQVQYCLVANYSVYILQENIEKIIYFQLIKLILPSLIDANYGYGRLLSGLCQSLAEVLRWDLKLQPTLSYVQWSTFFLGIAEAVGSNNPTRSISSNLVIYGISFEFIFGNCRTN